MFRYLLIAIVALLTVLYFWDRAAKKKGHQMRDPGQMGRLASEGRKDARAMGPAGGTTNDVSWTAYERHNAGLGERSQRENDALDDPFLQPQERRIED